MNKEPIVSIIINNYNYGRFLTEAIESALQQSYRRIEVIVVDDGSTDHSREMIAGYGDRIIPVLKANGGQASAFNAGFARSQGEIIIFLDADDLLLSETAERVVTAFHAHPNAGSVRYRLIVVDGAGTPTGTLDPPAHFHMLSGDLRYDVLTLPDHTTWPPTSGNAFATRILNQVFPIDDHDIRGCADYYVQRAAALFAPVISLDDVGGYYRTHGSNSFHTSAVNLDQIRWSVVRVADAYAYIQKLAALLDLAGYSHKTTDLLDVTYLAKRMISLKLDPSHHPIAGDMLASICWRGTMAAFRPANLSLPMKLLHVLWFWLMLLAPKPAARWLAKQIMYPKISKQLHKCFAVIRRVRKQVQTTCL
jgi:glycosyltransferase involved in cell wall biosynthesis